MGAPIVNGTPTSGDPAVVAVVARRTECDVVPDVICTGLLVGPRLVVSAAHCIERARPGSLEVFHGADVNAAGDFVVVSNLRAHPDYDPATGERDVALLFLAEPSPVAPYPLPSGSVGDLTVGSPLRAVGFGITARTAQDAGLKREGTLSLAAIREGSFDASPAPSLTCDLDSGGPVFGGDQFFGITARGDVACETTAFQVRVDQVLDFITGAIEESSAAPISGNELGACMEPEPPGQGDSGCQATSSASLGGVLLIALTLVKRARSRR